MSRRGRASAAAPVVGIVSTLAFSTAVASVWVRQSVTRTIGDAAVDETVTTTGMELVPLGVGATTQRMPARYDVDVDPADQEWQMATDPGDAHRSDEQAR